MRSVCLRTVAVLGALFAQGLVAPPSAGAQELVDLAITMTDTPDPVLLGSPLTYSIVVTNDGPGNAGEVAVEDSLPTTVSFVSVDPSDACSEDAGVVRCAFGAVAAGSQRTASIVVVADQIGAVDNTASVSSSVDVDVGLTNNSATTQTTVDPVADLSVAMSAEPQPVLRGEVVTYGITVGNAGPSTATGVTLTDVIPEGMAFSSAAASEGSCAEDAGTVTCALNDLEEGSDAAVTLELTAQTVGPVDNTATVSSDAFDPDSSNNSASASVNAEPAADLSVQVSDSRDPVLVGGGLTYTVTLANAGPDDATGTVLSDVLPDEATFGSAVADQGSCSQASGTVTCLLGAIPAGEDAEVVLGVTVSQPGTLTNAVAVSASEGDPNLADNQDAEETVAKAAAVFTDPDDVPAGAVPALDLKTIAHGADASTITYTVDTFDAWPSSAADFEWMLFTGNDPAPDYTVTAYWNGTAISGGVFNASGVFVSAVAITRPSGDSLEVSFSRAAIGTPASYRYFVRTYQDLNADSLVQADEYDLAPDSGTYTHQIGSPAGTGGGGTGTGGGGSGGGSGGGGSGGGDGTGGGGTGSSGAEPVIRLAGSDRIATSIAASKSAYPAGASAGAVVLSRSDAYADALAGVPLAAAKQAPLLLTPPGGLDTRTKAEIRRVLAPGLTVYLLGGEGAIGKAVASAITSMGYGVVRFAGADRFATAVVIADRGLSNPDVLLLATGTDFPDALGAGAAAATVAGAVLLTNGSRMPSPTASYLSAHPGATRYALGGPAAAADRGATPIVGADRYDTSRRAAERFFSAPPAVGVASGLTFADALAGGVHIAARGGPLVLSAPNALPAIVHDYLMRNAPSIASAYVFGGLAAVGARVERAVQNAISGVS
jgi:uncharacterized repeat protein (TIGR01451 family)